jgi:CheY-like chemotaxis protein
MATATLIDDAPRLFTVRARPKRESCQSPGILIVDDEPAIRRLLEMVLRRHGFRTWTAGDGREALAIYRQHRSAIAVVLLDVRMPGWDGPQTLRALQQLNPAVGCCFLTGDAGEYTEAELRQRGAAQVFAKPFAPTDLGSCLQGLYRDPSAG